MKCFEEYLEKKEKRQKEINLKKNPKSSTKKLKAAKS